jgi:hypothetical protein
MILVLLGLSLVFVAVGYIVTEKNAKNLLSGYNTMTEQERQAFDIKSYIPAFRKFHLFLGSSLFAAGTAIFILIGEGAAGIFMIVYPLLAYIWFLWIGKKYNKGQSSKWDRIGIVILGLALIFVITLLAIGLRESKIIVTSEEISIEGVYGETISVSEIETICLTDSLPLISLRTNGFSLGKIKKGFFKTVNGEKVKFLLNTESKPFLRIEKKTGEKLYFSSGKIPNQTINIEIQEKMPAIICPL